MYMYICSVPRPKSRLIEIEVGRYGRYAHTESMRARSLSLRARPHAFLFFFSVEPGRCASSLGRIRSCTLLPVATAAALCRHYGRSPYSIAFLRAFNEQVPTVTHGVRRGRVCKR